MDNLVEDIKYTINGKTLNDEEVKMNFLGGLQKVADLTSYKKYYEIIISVKTPKDKKVSDYVELSIKNENGDLVYSLSYEDGKKSQVFTTDSIKNKDVFISYKTEEVKLDVGDSVSLTASVEPYNAKTDEYVNMYDYGIIDPAKASRIALENAASVATMFLTTECAIV